MLLIVAILMMDLYIRCLNDCIDIRWLNDSCICCKLSNNVVVRDASYERAEIRMVRGSSSV